MKKWKSTGVVIGLLIILAIYYFTVEKNRPSDDELDATKGQVTIFSFSPASISALEIYKDTSVLALEKRGMQWMITKPEEKPADNNKVEELLANIRDMKANTAIELGKNYLQPANFGLDQIKKKIAFKEATKEQFTIINIGKQTPLQDGFYIRINDEQKIYAVGTFIDSLADSTLDDLKYVSPTPTPLPTDTPTISPASSQVTPQVESSSS